MNAQGHPEPTRTRQQGTQVTLPATADERMAAIRRIVTERQYAKVDGCMIDLFAASAIVAVYDALNDANRTRFAAYPAPRMAMIAFKLVK